MGCQRGSSKPASLSLSWRWLGSNSNKAQSRLGSSSSSPPPPPVSTENPSKSSPPPPPQSWVMGRARRSAGGGLHCCLAFLFKFLSFLQAFAAVSALLYAAWILSRWARHHHLHLQDLLPDLWYLLSSPPAHHITSIAPPLVGY